MTSAGERVAAEYARHQEEHRRGRGRRVERRVAVTAGLLMCALPVAMLVNLVSTFRLWGGPEETPASVHTYEALLVAAGVLLVASIVLAVRTGVRWVAFTALTMVPIVLVAAYLFSVPQGRWHQDGGSGPLPADYHPCYSGSGSCDEYGG